MQRYIKLIIFSIPLFILLSFVSVRLAIYKNTNSQKDQATQVLGLEEESVEEKVSRFSNYKLPSDFPSDFPLIEGEIEGLWTVANETIQSFEIIINPYIKKNLMSDYSKLLYDNGWQVLSQNDTKIEFTKENKNGYIRKANTQLSIYIFMNLQNIENEKN